MQDMNTKIKDKAVNAFPIIEKNIENITTNFKDTVGKQSQNINDISSNFSKLVKENENSKINDKTF